MLLGSPLVVTIRWPFSSFNGSGGQNIMNIITTKLQDLLLFVISPIRAAASSVLSTYPLTASAPNDAAIHNNTVRHLYNKGPYVKCRHGINDFCQQIATFFPTGCFHPNHVVRSDMFNVSIDSLGNFRIDEQSASGPSYTITYYVLDHPRIQHGPKPTPFVPSRDFISTTRDS